ncbi:MAG: 2-phospho-L-lactate guanylyltransferase [Betaproteobacteria bacterium]|nr:MAG: 2-phospho-L-lactate guanylyltransferase [Betaproteobacteria bacterium]
MSDWLVVPVKSLRGGKTRLAHALAPAHRRALMDQLLVHIVTQATPYPGLDKTVIVSGCGETRARAIELGVRAIAETRYGLNAAIRQGQLALRQWGASKMLVVPCDLPMLDSEDLRQLSQLCKPDLIAIAPDRRGVGTNGLCLDPHLEFVFQFGPDSYRGHIASALRLGLEHDTAHCPGLAFDVDTPEDLAEWYQSEENRFRNAPLTADRQYGAP